MPARTLASLSLLLAAASPAPVPQARAIDAGLRGLGAERVANAHGDRLGRTRLPLSFPEARSHGCHRIGTDFNFCVRGHGRSAKRYRSISFELLFGDLPRLEAHLESTARLIDAAGLGGDSREAALGLLRAMHGRMAPVHGWPEARANDSRVAGSVQVRVEGRMSIGPAGSLAYLVLQFTDISAPQAAWPSPGDVEALFPYSRRRGYDVNADILSFPDPNVVDLRCRSAGPAAYRCRYVVTIDDWLGTRAPRDHYSDLYVRRADGTWRLDAADAERR